MGDKSSDEINNSWHSDDGKNDLFSSDDEREDNDDSGSQLDKTNGSIDTLSTENNALDSSQGVQSQGMCWADLMEQEELAEARTPGRSVHMHEKLSSPSRKRSPMVSFKKFEEKLSKAEALREKHLQDIANRSREVTEKIVKARDKKEEHINKKRIEIDSKMQKAEETRKKHLK